MREDPVVAKRAAGIWPNMADMLRVLGCYPIGE